MNTPEILGKIRHVFADHLEDPKNERFKALPSSIRNEKLDYWFSIDTYQPLLGEFLYARCVDNMIMYLKNILEEIIAKESNIKRNNGKDISYIKIHDIKKSFKKRGFELFSEKEDRDWFDEVTKNRNIIVHNGGIINEAYLKKVPNSRFKAGDRIFFTFKEISQFCIKLTNFVALLDINLAYEFLLDLVSNTLPKSSYNKEI